MRFRRFLFLSRLLLLYFLYLLSLDKSDSLYDKSVGGGSDSRSFGMYSFRNFYKKIVDSGGSISGLGSDIFVRTGFKSKCGIFSFDAFMTIGFESKGG